MFLRSKVRLVRGLTTLPLSMSRLSRQREIQSLNPIGLHGLLC
jgi:hypothetical protein